MIFIANVLVMNGGTTFILRMARHYSRQNRRCAVLLLSDRSDPALLEELGKYSDIIHLWDYSTLGVVASNSLLHVFAPLARSHLLDRIAPYGPHIHCMSVFGLILTSRLLPQDSAWRVTVGIYHQNEFLFRPLPFHFPRQIQHLFAAVPSANLIFFNETTRDNYAQFYGRSDLDDACILPIGVAIDHPPAPPPPSPGRRILSIGNLEEFKVYNRHMISVVAKLQSTWPDIRYDIYGTGPEAARLASLIEELGVQDKVTLHGALDYARLPETVAQCDLFVGSGTALIEAAAAGRPALIGVESLPTPETYGFLSDAVGYSYNENVPGIPKRNIIDLVQAIFTDAHYRRRITEECVAKAHQFSVTVTAAGFDEVGRGALPLRHRLRGLAVTRLFASLIAMTLSERLGWSKSFDARRNQSY